MEASTRDADGAADGTPPANPFERLASAYLVQEPIRSDAARSVRDVVADVVRDRSVDDPSALTGIDGVYTAALFLDESSHDPTLTWYLEVDRSVAEKDSTGTSGAQHLRTQSPLYDAGIDEFLASSDRPRAIGGPLSSEDVFTHAWHPERPRGSVAVADRDEPVVPSASSDDPSVEVALVEARVKPGVASWFVEWLATRSHGSSGGWIERSTTGWEEAIIRAEGMYTETIFLDRTADGVRLLQFMEADSFERVFEAYTNTWNPMARGTAFAMKRLLDRPERILERPLPAENELLVHAVGSNRPRTWRVRREASMRSCRDT
ncbi:hypothetical protein [Halovivax cerinus]|uniref:Uncharacterized protein n=1 Tax=Halovivax cerinus TaxID=1487865 RepID=A0ABD5NT81_9EURY|nr:hypothetical protein [Halovivax cerinus]